MAWSAKRCLASSSDNRRSRLTRPHSPRLIGHPSVSPGEASDKARHKPVRSGGHDPIRTREMPPVPVPARGAGCSRPSRSAVGMVHVVLGLCLAAEDEELQEAIRRELKKAIGSRAGEPRLGRARTLGDDGRSLLALCYADKLSAELFVDGEARLSGQIQAIRRDQEEPQSRLSDLAARFEGVAGILQEMDVQRPWARGHRPRAPVPRRGAAGVRRHVPRSRGGHGERRATAERHTSGRRPDRRVAVLWCRRNDTNDWHTASPR